MRVRYRLTGTCLAALMLSAIAGCGTETGGGNSDAASSTPTSTSQSGREVTDTVEPSASAAPTSTQPAPTTLSKPSAAPDTGTTTLRGQLAEPVEAGCVVLSTDDGTYVLLGVPKKVSRLDPGTALVVRGSVAKSKMTTCQQGTPFEVDTATPA